MTREEASFFFRRVGYRCGCGAMMLTTNKGIRDGTELLAGDEILATAILDRLPQRARILDIRGRGHSTGCVIRRLPEVQNPAVPNAPPRNRHLRPT